jgi:hypothetical protein
VFGTATAGRGQTAIFDIWDSDALRGLEGLPGELAAPLFIDYEKLVRAGTLSPTDRERYWRELQDAPSANRPVATPLLLQIANSAGNIYDEELLQFLPGALSNPLVASPEGPLSQNEIDRLWEEGTDSVTISGSFHEEIIELSNQLRDWASAPEASFPFHFSRSGPTSPGIRSVLTITFLPAVDRVWHRLRPAVFQFRPASQAERYEAEASYWRSVGDHRRAELAEEIRGRCMADSGDAGSFAPDAEPASGAVNAEVEP